MQFKHWLVVFLCFAVPFGWYLLYWMPKQELRRKRLFFLSEIKVRLIPALIELKSVTPVECFYTIKAFMHELKITEAELGYSLNYLAHFALLCLENQITEVAGERDTVHAQLVDTKTNAGSFPSTYQWATHVECTHNRFKELCDKHNELFMLRGKITSTVDLKRSAAESRQTLLFLFGEAPVAKV